MNGQVAGPDRVLVMAPYRQDAVYLGRLLEGQAISCTIAGSSGEIAGALRPGQDVLILTNEAVQPAVIDAVGACLVEQPRWSELPVILLLDKGAPIRRIRDELGRAWPRARCLFHERPIRATDLLSAVQSALLIRAGQREIGDYIAREVELRHELDHRIKNMLMVIESLFAMSARSATSIEAIRQDFGGRLRAISQVHSATFTAEQPGVTIGDVARLTLSPYAGENTRRIVIEGPELPLTREAATTLTLCLHELATNAVKYGALSSGESGQVVLRWTEGDAKGPNTLEWREAGGPAVREPDRRGYGTRYLTGALGGMFGGQAKIEFAPDGLVVTVSGSPGRPGIGGI